MLIYLRPPFLRDAIRFEHRTKEFIFTQRFLPRCKSDYIQIVENVLTMFKQNKEPLKLLRKARLEYIYKEYITPEDLWDKPIIRSRQSIGKNKIGEWFKKSEEELNIVATGNLLYNMSLLVEEGLGYAVSLDKILNTTGNSNLCFRPLYPQLISHLDIAWKKYQVFPKCAEIFLKRLQENL